MRWIVLLGVVASAGCNGDITGGLVTQADGGRGIGMHPGDGGTTISHGDGGTTMTSNPCPDGQHMAGGACVADEVTCAAEFPCDAMHQCVGGVCITTPGTCATNNDCPVGYVCSGGTCIAQCLAAGGMCSKDADCPAMGGVGQVCVQCQCKAISTCATPTADISGAPAFTVSEDLDLSQALGSFGGAVAGVLKTLRDAITGNCSSATCFLIAPFISSILPQWAQDLIVGVGDFADLIDNKDFHVDGTMLFTKNGSPSGYTVTENWTMLSFSYMGMQVMSPPQNIPQIGKPIVLTYPASAVCGVLYMSKHDIDGVLSGLLKWMVDTVVYISSNGMYMDLGDAIANSVDCSQIGNITAQIACQGLVGGLSGAIDNAISSWLLKYSLMTLQGTANVTDANHLDNGQWMGTLGSLGGLFNNFTGTWSGQR